MRHRLVFSNFGERAEERLHKTEITKTGPCKMNKKFISSIERGIFVKYTLIFVAIISLSDKTILVDKTNDKGAAGFKHPECLSECSVHIIQETNGRDHEREVKFGVSKGIGLGNAVCDVYASLPRLCHHST